MQTKDKGIGFILQIFVLFILIFIIFTYLIPYIRGPVGLKIDHSPLRATTFQKIK